MALILCIETGTDICSVGIVKDGELISLRESDAGRDHASKVGVFVDELLRETGISPQDIDAVAVGKGPGSYTGLRIGVSFAKGLCYALSCPLIAVNSMEALANVAIEDYEAGIIDIDEWQNATLCPMVDARRMEVYAQLFNTKGESCSEVSAEIITEESFAQVRNQSRLIIFGSGAAKCTEVLSDATAIEITPSVRGMAKLAQKAFDANDFVDVAYFEPFYLKNFVVTTSKKKLF
ncbi:MAG: tRNA (adenosine(37)-N6)-threonylcarbamoyltransferase complex dimerization subunit type 1 TsaB [Alistipes sp.]|nr:tRNA (adenosine(37)-N6)-threonylcarbamoyltransferase complex dimerization subunit type 1 TsaB [Alistipes sp.]